MIKQDNSKTENERFDTKLKRLCTEYLENYYEELPRRSKHMQIAYLLSNGHYGLAIKIYNETKAFTNSLDTIGMSLYKPDNVFKQAKEKTFKLYLLFTEYKMKMIA